MQSSGSTSVRPFPSLWKEGQAKASTQVWALVQRDWSILTCLSLKPGLRLEVFMNLSIQGWRAITTLTPVSSRAASTMLFSSSWR